MPHQNIASTKRMRSADFPVLPQPSPKKQRHGQRSPFRAVADESVWDIRSSDQGTPPRAQHKDPATKSKLDPQTKPEVEAAPESEEWSIDMQCSQFPLLLQATGKALIEEAAKDLQLPRCRLAWPIWRCLSWFRRAYILHPGVDAPSIDRQSWEEEHLQSFKTVLDMLREKSEDWFTLPIASRRNEQSKFSGEVIGNEQFYTDLDELILPMLTGCIQVILQKCRIQKGGLSEGGAFYRMSKLSVQGTARLLFLQLSLAGALDNARAVEDTQLMDGDEDEDGFMPVKGFDPTRRLRIYKVTRAWLSELRLAIHFGNDAYC